MERTPLNQSGTEANRKRLWRLREAGSWIASALGRRRAVSEQAASPPSEDDDSRERWQPYTGANFVVDPDPRNYAHYPADDALSNVGSKAEFDAWIEQQRAATPPKTFHERLGEIATSEPFTDHEQMIDPETGHLADWWNSPEGLYAEPVIMPRTQRTEPRDPSQPNLIYDCDDGWIKQRLPDGSMQPTIQYAPGGYFN